MAAGARIGILDTAQPSEESCTERLIGGLYAAQPQMACARDHPRPVQQGGEGRCAADAVFVCASRQNINIEPTRVYDVEDARAFLADKGIDVDALAPQVEGKFMAAFVRAVKPKALAKQ